MHLFAAYTTWQRARDVPSVFGLSLVAYSASALVTLGVLFGFQIYELEGRTIVPLAGIVVGNSLSATVLVSRRLVDAGRERRSEIEGRLALGLSASDAFQPILRDSLRTALIPQIETTKAVGIIALPGAMVGLILAGTDPADAVRVQISVMYLVLDSVATTTSEEDEPIREIGRRLGLRVESGHPTDLLDRHVQAGRAAGADAVAKIPSDCPLIDPGVIDTVIGRFRAEPDADFILAPLEALGLGAEEGGADLPDNVL